MMRAIKAKSVVVAITALLVTAVVWLDAAAQSPAPVATVLASLACEAPKPAMVLEKDDLTRLPGLDGKLQKRLNDLGVARYDQVTAWKPDDVAEFNARLGFEYRLEQQKWIHQARRLASGGKTGYCERWKKDHHRSLPGGGDDFRCIQYVTISQARLLKEFSFRTYADLAGLSEVQARQLALKLGMQAQIELRGWVGHASKLREAREQLRASKVKSCVDVAAVLTHTGRSVVLFDTMQSVIKPEFTDRLVGAIAEIEKACSLPKIRLRVEGHTDAEDARGKNKDLSEERAQAVVTSLIDKRGQSLPLCWSGYSALRPTAPNDTAENKARNRRVEIVVESW